jgi:hypothetical protein
VAPCGGRLLLLGGLAPPLPHASPSLRARRSAASPPALTFAPGPLVGDAPENDSGKRKERPIDSPLTSPLRVQAWPDAVIDRIGHLPTSAYFEWLWLPQIGPSTAWAYRRLTEGLTVQPDGYSIDLEVMAAWLGVGGVGHNSPLVRSLRRLVRFHLALHVDEHTLAVRGRVPPLNQRQVRRLPPSLQRTHLRLANTAPTGGEPEREAAN